MFNMMFTFGIRVLIGAVGEGYCFFVLLFIDRALYSLTEVIELDLSSLNSSKVCLYIFTIIKGLLDFRLVKVVQYKLLHIHTWCYIYI